MDAIVEQEKAASTRIRRNEGVRVQGSGFKVFAMRRALCAVHFGLLFHNTF